MNNKTTTGVRTRKIPPPPSPDAGYDAIIAYHKRYSVGELERAGYAVKPSPAEIRGLEDAADRAIRRRAELQVKLSAKEFEELRHLAKRRGFAVEILASKWIKQRLRQESQR